MDVKITFPIHDIPSAAIVRGPHRFRRPLAMGAIDLIPIVVLFLLGGHFAHLAGILLRLAAIHRHQRGRPFRSVFVGITRWEMLTGQASFRVFSKGR